MFNIWQQPGAGSRTGSNTADVEGIPAMGNGKTSDQSHGYICDVISYVNVIEIEIHMHVVYYGYYGVMGCTWIKSNVGVIESGMYDSGMIIPIVPVKW